MDAFLTQPVDRQRVLFEEAGRRLGLSAGSVEKDLWVCWTLRALFRLPSSGPHLTFKGGTSLAKGWKLIERFSEDIDIVIDREFLGFGGADAAEAAPSNKQRAKRLASLMLAAQHHIRDVLGPAMEQEIQRLLPSTGYRAVFFRRSREAQTSFKPGSLRLVPDADRIGLWQRDYDAMRESMFFGEAPPFEELIAAVSDFQGRFNAR